MSVVIYDGFRFKSKRTKEFLGGASTLCHGRFSEWIDRRIGLTDILGLSDEAATALLRLRLTELEAQMRMAVFAGSTSAYYAEVGYFLHNGDDGYTYGWDYGPFTPAGREIADFVEEYSAWVDAPKPDGIGAAEWRLRWRTWKKVALDRPGSNLMVAPIISFAPPLTTTTSWLWIDYYQSVLQKMQENTHGRSD